MHLLHLPKAYKHNSIVTTWADPVLHLLLPKRSMAYQKNQLNIDLQSVFICFLNVPTFCFDLFGLILAGLA